MTVVQTLGAMQERHELLARQADFISLAKMLLASGGRFDEASQLAERSRASARVREILSSPAAAEILGRAIEPTSAPGFTERAAVGAHSLTGSVFADYKIAAAGFAAALANVGIFDRLLAGGFDGCRSRLLQSAAYPPAPLAPSSAKAAQSRSVLWC